MFPDILSGSDYTSILSDVFDRIETSKIVMCTILLFFVVCFAVLNV